jgi:hypothetical protein
MKTCGYCGRENEEDAVFCKECGLSEFPETASAQEVPAIKEAEPEIPTPDVGPDQEAAICPFCLFPNLPDPPCCKRCGTPFNTSVMGPFEGALAEGFMWRSVVRGRPKRWVMLVVWVLFSPLFCVGALSILTGIIILDPFVLITGALSAVIALSMLYQVTKNYVNVPKVKLDE